MTRTAPFSAKAIRNACIAAAFALPPVGFIGLAAIGNGVQEQANQSNIVECNKGNDGSCEFVKAEDLGLITNEAWKARKAEIAKAAADKKAAEAKAIADAEAKFKAEGWFELKPGIYGRWCTQTCSNADVIGSASYWLMEVWAKDRAAGDIYAQINVLEDGVVVGWTNDTAYLSQGQRGVLTFSKYTPGHGSRYTAQLVKFNARG